MRILIAGTGSGCGKTTASILLMACLKRRGLSVAPYKAGPDYIDPGFHRRVCGRASYNLDTWLMDEDEIARLLWNDADISVIEGVMGYYDGLDARDMRCSAWELARMTRTPVLLVVDASGGAASVAATVKGFQTLKTDSGICGVLVNRASGDRHYELIKQAVKEYTGLDCAGYLTKQAAVELPSRHLGLVTARETPDLMNRINDTAVIAQQTLDLDKVLSIAGKAPDIPQSSRTVYTSRRGFRLGVALDDVFHFYYDANLEALKDAGMELVFFSPLRDACLPGDLDGLYIGGGYPEVYAEGLERNAGMRGSIKSALENGLRCYAECGGLMYLGENIDGREMCRVLPVNCRMTARLQRFGYVTVEDRTGLSFPAHEFHHAVAEPTDEVETAYKVIKASAPDRSWACGYEKYNTLAAFAHVYFAHRPDIIGRFWP
ncbi:MAG: cobyrinate a,c-diamide synthase [Clostridiales bacterium]|nr:cobyrinate a,c-diamide synthase [Clostridiales bacterium]